MKRGCVAQEALKVAEILLKSPESIISPEKVEIGDKIVSLAKDLFLDLQKASSGPLLNHQSKRRKLISVSLKLQTTALDQDQIWEQAKPIVTTLSLALEKSAHSPLTLLRPSCPGKSRRSSSDNGDNLSDLDSNSPTETAKAGGDGVEKGLTIASWDRKGDMTDCFNDSNADSVNEADGMLSSKADSKCGAESLGDEVDEVPDDSTRKAKKKKKSPVDDEFFKLDEMEKFVNEAEQFDGKMVDDDETNDDGSDEGSDEGSDQLEQEDRHLDKLLDELEAEEGNDTLGENLSSNGGKFDTESDDKENSDLNTEAEVHDEEEYEDQIQENDKVNDSGVETENDSGDINQLSAVASIKKIAAAKSKVSENKRKNLSRILALTKKEEQLRDAIEDMEQELIENKHWSLMGEVGAKQRSTNSLLEIHLDLPQYHHQKTTDTFPDALGTLIGDSDDVEKVTADLKGEELTSKISKFIEKLTKQRIRDLTFDDVERKYVLPPSQRPANATEDPLAGLDFRKSRVGLADIYAEQYTVEILGGKSKMETELERKKVSITQLFAKVMYKLDSLSHQRALPKPTRIADGTPKDIAAITVEDTIPVTMSELQRVAPEEKFAPGHEKKVEEMNQEERRALRNAKKERRKKAVKGKVVSGEFGIKEAAKRKIHLNQKNKQAKEEKKQKKATGLISGDLKSAHSFSSGKRFKGNELLAQVFDEEKIRKG